MRFRQAILATIACLLLPFSFAELITSKSYFSRQRACAFLLASVITAKPAIRYQFKTGQRDWPKT
jgi:hypothetical protein